MTRVLVGTYDIAGMVTNLAQCFRAAGCHVETAVTAKHQPFYGHLEYNHMIHEKFPNAVQYKVTPQGELTCVISDGLAKFLDSFDVFLFVAGHSFAIGGLDLAYLSRRGKTIISFFCGGEIRHWWTAEPMWETWGTPLPEAIRNRAPLGTSPQMVDVVRHGVYHGTLANCLHNLRVAEAFSSVIFNIPEQAGLALRPYHVPRMPLDLGKCRFAVPGREVPRVAHIPSSRGVKRTTLILDMLDRLREDGVRFDLHLIEGRPQTEVLEALTDADVLVDEMCLAPGVLSHEAMASGCAVLTGNHEGSKPIPPGRPILHIEPGNLADQLRRALTDRSLRIDLAMRGRRYVEDQCEPASIGRFMLDCAAQAARGDADHYPRYIFADYVPKPDEVIPDYLGTLSWQIVSRHGAPPDADLARLVATGVLPSSAEPRLGAVPRWQVDVKETARWVLCRSGR